MNTTTLLAAASVLVALSACQARQQNAQEGRQVAEANAGNMAMGNMEMGNMAGMMNQAAMATKIQRSTACARGVPSNRSGRGVLST